ncbi:MAG: NAD(P)/FAD-dependent oxidoreductase [Anaerolineales bacterium]
MNIKKLPHIVIVGAGFGGMEVARRLKNAPVQITLIDRHNYHLFQPLLYQIAIAGLVPSQIAYPLRTIFRNQKNISFQMGEVTSIDFESRYVKMNGSFIAYDYLVLAVGGQTNFFGINSVEENGFQLKNVESAVNTRNHLLQLFERASREVDAEKRRAMLTFAVVGAGPTGVETAGALAELIVHVIAKDYPQMDLSEVRVLLLEAGSTVMPAYPDELRKATADLLRKKNVEIVLNAKLTNYENQQIKLADGTTIGAHTLIWTAGVKASEITKQSGSRWQAPVGSEPTRICGFPLTWRSSSSVMQPMWRMEMVSHYPCWQLSLNSRRASQRRTSSASLKKELKPFHYKDPGLLATIGRNAAVARIWGLSFSGFIAWVIWVGLHIYRLIGFRNRILVLINWAWDYFFYENQVRLITKE